MSIKIAVVGLGKIATDQHLRVIRTQPDFELVAVASPNSIFGNTPAFKSIAELAKSGIEVDAVTLCMPPKFRFDIARNALNAGYDILLERPPTATLGEFEALVAQAEQTGRVLFAAWHSKHNASVAEAKKYLQSVQIKRLRISWKEDVRFWHPGQEWIWEPGGFGVFDPGINAFSILTEIMPFPVFIKEARILKPSNKQTAIAAFLTFGSACETETDWTAEFDWLQPGKPSWDIHIETEDGLRILLSNGGTHLHVNGDLVHAGSSSEEYEEMYRHFLGLLSSRQSDVDGAPLRLVSDAYAIATIESSEPFY